MSWHTSIALRAAGLAVAAAGTLLAACGSESTAPGPELVGTWDLVGFTDAGVAAVTTGIWIFRSDGTMHVDGTVTFPDEPTEPLVLDGGYIQTGQRVTLTIGAESGAWALVEDGNELTLTQDEPPPANIIVLRRQSLGSKAYPSARSTMTGSMRVMARAGVRIASVATPKRSPVTAPSVATSVGATS